MLFNGAPSFIASMKKDSAFSNIITYDPSEKLIKIDAGGFPSGPGAWIEHGATEETAKITEFVDPIVTSKMIRQKNWWSEDEKKLTSRLDWFKEGNVLVQQRTLVDDNTLSLHLEMTKKDGTKGAWTAILKRS